MRKKLVSTVGAVVTLAAVAFGEIVFPVGVARDANEVSHLRLYGRRVTSRPLDAEAGRAYVLSGEFRAESGTPELSFGLEMRDARGRQLRAFEYTRLPGSGLHLSAAAEKGARELSIPGCGKWDLKLGDLLVAEKHPRTPLKIAKTKDDRILVLAGKLPFDLPKGAEVALHCGAPPFSAGTPLPRRRSMVPFWVPGAIFMRVRPEMVGTSTIPP